MFRIDIERLIFNQDQFDEFTQDHMEHRHGISRYDIIEALEFGICKVKKKSENLYEVYLKSEDGPYLLVPMIYPMRGGNGYFVITARSMTPNEIKKFKG
ncbi:MAG TPA: hypothetical protein VGE40_07100 [Bacilli bacterium]